jgi:hypothetical protein
MKNEKRTASNKSRKQNSLSKYQSIKKEFGELCSTKVDGMRPRIEDVIKKLSEKWCISVARVETILRMDI